MRRHYINITMVIIAMGLREVFCRAFTTDEGPFEAHVYNISNCVKEKPWFHTNVTIHTSKGRRLLRGNVITKQPMKNIKFNIQLYYIEDGKIKAFELRNQNCQNLVVRVVLHVLAINYNAQRCTMEPTNSEFSNLDIDAIMHTVTQSLWYGNVVVRWEMAVMATPLMCLDINLQIHKINGNKVVKT